MSSATHEQENLSSSKYKLYGSPQEVVPSTRYMRISLTDKHIHSVRHMATGTLRFLQCNLCLGPTTFKTRAYNTQLDHLQNMLLLFETHTNTRNHQALPTSAAQASSLNAFKHQVIRLWYSYPFLHTPWFLFSNNPSYYPPLFLHV